MLLKTPTQFQIHKYYCRVYLSLQNKKVSIFAARMLNGLRSTMQEYRNENMDDSLTKAIVITSIKSDIAFKHKCKIRCMYDQNAEDQTHQQI